jgi:hypothetical protein
MQQPRRRHPDRLDDALPKSLPPQNRKLNPHSDEASVSDYCSVKCRQKCNLFCLSDNSATRLPGARFNPLEQMGKMSAPKVVTRIILWLSRNATSASVCAHCGTHGQSQAQWLPRLSDEHLSFGSPIGTRTGVCWADFVTASSWWNREFPRSWSGTGRTLARYTSSPSIGRHAP